MSFSSSVPGKAIASRRPGLLRVLGTKEDMPMCATRLGTILSTLIFVLAAVAVCGACSGKAQQEDPSTTTALGTTAPTTAPRSASPAGTTAFQGTVITLKTVSIVDDQGTGTEAFSMLVPTDWEYEGGVQWILDNPGMPAISQFRVWNPRGTEEFSVFPSQAFFWTDNGGTLQLFPPGSKYFGNEVRELLTPLEALEQVVIPRYRSGVQGLKVVKQEEISDVVLPSGASSQSPLQTSTRAGKVRLEYTDSGRAYEDEIYCIVEATYYPLQSTFGSYTNIMWGVNYIGSFRAEKGKLDASARLFQAISNSVTLNVQWFNTYVQIIEYLIKMQIQQIKSIGQLGSIIAQTGSEIRQENLDLYYQREAMNDRVSTQFSEYVRGVDSYYNPLEEKNVELPSGYDNVWVNNLGEYVITDNPNYNPNVGGNQNFQRLEPAKK
jgi:hypothetical protein